MKLVLRYLRGSHCLGIVFGKDDLGTELHGYSDPDWGGCLQSRKSTSGYAFRLCGGPISWASPNQTVVAKSTCKVDYIALSEACKEAAWLRRYHADILGTTSDPTLRIGCGNAGTIVFAQNESTNLRNKHIDITVAEQRTAIRLELDHVYEERTHTCVLYAYPTCTTRARIHVCYTCTTRVLSAPMADSDAARTGAR